MKQRIRYRSKKGKDCHIIVDVDEPIRKGTCEACKKSVESGKINRTQLHHWKYSYSVETVKKNPLLALEETSELCFYDHTHIADPLKKLSEVKDLNRVVAVLDTAPDEVYDKLIYLILYLYDALTEGKLKVERTNV